MSPEARVRALPCWNGPIEISTLKGGVSNASFTVTDMTGTYVARIGEDYPFHHVFREAETRTSRAAHAAGLSPEVIHTEPSVMVLRHIEARTYAEADVRANAEACVEMVKRCHRDMPARVTGRAAFFWVFHVLRDYAQTLKAGGHRRIGDIARWLETAGRLERAQVPLPIVFGHHDLLPTNFLDDGKRLWLIDWEYGGFGTAMFDLAGMAAVNSFGPNEERGLLEAYFEREPDEATWRAFDAMKTAGALREAVWGMVSELYLAAPGVDYAAYAAEYLGRFEAALETYESRYGAP